VFQMDARRIIYIPDLPPSISDVNKSMEEFGTSRFLYREAFFGVSKDVPGQVREYGGMRLRLYSNDYVHLPMFNPTVARRPGHFGSPVCPMSSLWRLLSVPPGRSEALSSFLSGDRHEEMGDDTVNRPSPRNLSQVYALFLGCVFARLMISHQRSRAPHRPTLMEPNTYRNLRLRGRTVG
jgi:hypothetical protein